MKPETDVKPDPTSSPQQAFGSGGARIKRALGMLESLIVRLSSAAVSLGLWPVLIPVALGATAWIAANPEQLSALSNNSVTLEGRKDALSYTLAGFIFFGLLMGLAAAGARMRGLSPLQAAKDLVAASRWLCAGPLIAALFTPAIETRGTKLTFAIILTIVVLIASSISHGQRRLELVGKSLFGTGRDSWWVCLSLTALLIVGYAVFFSALSITNHQALNTRTFDLALYDNIFFESAHGNPLGCVFLKSRYHGSAHFDPILVLLSPLYRLYPRAEFILSLQAAWVALGAFPAFLLGHRHLRSPVAGLVVALAYLAGPCLHGANMYEFHSLTLVVMPMMWAWYALDCQKGWLYWLSFAGLLLVREDVPLLLCFLGAALLLKRERWHLRTGLLTIAISVTYFVVVKAAFMPSSEVFMGGKSSYSYEYYYRQMIPRGEGLRGFIVSAITNPVFALKHAFREAKIEFLLTLLVPLMGLPLLAKRRRFVLLYGAVFVLLATRKYVYSPHFQYAMILYPTCVALTPAAIARLRGRRERLLPGWGGERAAVVATACVLFASLLCSWKFGGVIPNDAFRGGFRRMTRTLTESQAERYRDLRALIDQIPATATLAASDSLTSHVSGRRHITSYREGDRSDYVLIKDSDVSGGLRARHSADLSQGALRVVEQRGQLGLYTRRPDVAPSQNPKLSR